MASGYPQDWEKRRKRVLKRDKYTCQSCGKKGGWSGTAELHVHHIRPKSEGGGHHLYNLTTVCARCHAAIHDDARLRPDQTSSGLLGRLLGGSDESEDRRQQRQNGVARLKREAEKRKQTGTSTDMSYWQQQVEEAYNEEFDGCLSCGREVLTVDWISRGEKKAKAIECNACGAVFEETVVHEEDEPKLTLERVTDASEIETVPSAIDYELYKHLELGSFENRSVTDFKEKLLSEVDTQEEEILIEAKFDQFEGVTRGDFPLTESPFDGVTARAESTQADGGTSADSDGCSDVQESSPSGNRGESIDEIEASDPMEIRKELESKYGKEGLKQLLEEALGDEYNRDVSNSLRNDFMRAFFRRVDQKPADVDFLSGGSYRGLAKSHGEKYALATALNYYLTKQDIRERAAIKSLTKTVLASMITAIYLHDSVSIRSQVVQDEEID